MSVIRWAWFGWKRTAPLCASCAWGTVLSSEGRKKKETFCRIVTPSYCVPFPVRECTSYWSREAPKATAKSEERQYGFVTTISLSENSSRDVEEKAVSKNP